MEAKTEEIIDLAQQNKSNDLVKNSKTFDILQKQMKQLTKK